MFNPDDICITINGYLTKIKRVIDTQTSFTWFKNKYVPKKRIDDLLCCIEGSFPDEYRENIKTHGGSNMSGYRAYQKLTASLRRKALLSSESYSIVYEEVLSLMKSFQSNIRYDLRKVCESDNNMF